MRKGYLLMNNMSINYLYLNSSEFWGTIIFGTCMLTLAIGNAFTTITVLQSKSKNRFGNLEKFKNKNK